MGVVCLTENDLRKMVQSTVSRVLCESADEVRGSMMAEKENEIGELVKYISQWYEQAKTGTPHKTGSFRLPGTGEDSGIAKVYEFIVPTSLSAKLGISDNFEIFIHIIDYTVPKQYLGYFGFNERETTGRSFGGPDFTKFNKTTIKFEQSLIDLVVPSINGELQLRGLYATLYHELNHAGTTLNISKKAFAKGYDDMIGKSLPDAANKRSRGECRHGKIQISLSPPNPATKFIHQFNYGPDYEKFRAANFLLYSLWETTELNALAEEMYGELQHANITEDQFEEFYKGSSLCHAIKQSRELLNNVMEADDDSSIWNYIGYMIHEKSRGRAKKRFAYWTSELIKKLYKKGMRIAKLYFDRHRKAPGM